MVRTRTLESRVAELEAEASRLLRALETQKSAFEDGEIGMKRKIAESAKDLAAKVSFCSEFHEKNTDYDSQSSEVEMLKTRLKMYADYDEIKRELEIMKVCILSQLTSSRLIHSAVCRIRSGRCR